MNHEPLDRVQFEAAPLLDQYPPRWRHRNKIAVFEIARSSGFPFAGVIQYACWPAISVPETVVSHSQWTVRSGVFDYVPDPTGAFCEWHMNFADPNLFVAYDSTLLAQDELQVAEHPLLGSLRDALNTGRKYPRTEDYSGKPTPITITGVQRRCAIDTLPNSAVGRPYGLYGNAFARAPIDQVLAACQPITPPTFSNILAIAAPVGGPGIYSRDQILHILSIAYSGFMAARCESQNLVGLKARTLIHTGFWGCGAFGGNRTLMTFLQALAADLADVNLQFHAFDEAGMFLAEEALDGYAQVRATSASVAHIVDRLLNQGLTWGESDGN